MDVILIKAINDFYQFDLAAGQEEVVDHLRQTLHLDEQSATLAMAELIANNYLQIRPQRMTNRGSRRMQAVVGPGPKLNEHAALGG
jgi:hypothetical protein